ncbi:MAG: hypothetical protein IPJ47_17430 [Anaerolineales bacterium]|nr:hypothetical protein [Anaerolineales bacterium]
MKVWRGVLDIDRFHNKSLKLSLVELAANICVETLLALETTCNSLVELSVQDMFPLTVVWVAPGPATQLILAVSPEGALGYTTPVVAVAVAVGLGVLVMVGAGEVGVTTSFNLEVSPLITAYCPHSQQFCPACPGISMIQ